MVGSPSVGGRCSLKQNSDVVASNGRIEERGTDMQPETVNEFVDRHFQHFNAATLRAAAQAWKELLTGGGRMFLAMAGAMSTAELGISLAEMIRQNKLHAVCCTGANLEEDVFNLVAHNDYVRVPQYRELSSAEEEALLRKKLNRVTDTCIPEDVMRRVEGALARLWAEADRSGTRRFPHEYLYQLLRDGTLQPHYQIDPKDSWLVAASEKNLPIFVPGWEDSTLGNLYAAHCIQGKLKNPHTVRTGMEYMMDLAAWYERESAKTGIGFFQIGGGIAGDFPICVVPLLRQDLKRDKVPLWSYFCQISDSTTSYGSYSGAVPNEKITWCKLGKETPRFVIESDATIVAPLIFACVLGW
jgi:deoxyhypusine synthase